MDDCVNGYLQDIQEAFPRFSNLEKRFFRDFKDSVYSFEEQCPKCDAVSLMREFGTPEEIVKDFYEHSGIALYGEICRRQPTG
jgi:ABC-type sulfate transport system substrate-binding protein